MALRVVGAGLGRTGTHSLQLALQQLLGGRCYHMTEVFGRPDDIPEWRRAIEGEPPADWDVILGDYVAAVDWPVAAFWRELSVAYPDAVVLLSSRDTEGWWRSANDTIFQISTRGASPESGGPGAAQLGMAADMLTKRFSPNWSDEATAKLAYERHNADVRASVPADRLVDWQPGAGWDPICAALGLPVPDAPFPHVNTTAEFRAMTGMDPMPS